MKESDLTTVPGYFQQFPEETRKILEEVRAAIRAAAPDAQELISYGMPTYKIGGKPLVYFGAFKHHVGFYATPTGHEAFEEALSAYKRGKGSVQFPLDRPMPLQLITDIVKYRLTEVSKTKKPGVHKKHASRGVESGELKIESYAGASFLARTPQPTTTTT